MVKEKIEVSELFISLQGEGPSVGTPAVFIRTRGCPLRCQWCDTLYAVDPRHPDYARCVLLTPAELVLEVRKLSRDVPTLLVITGGEPMIWEAELARLVDSLLPLHYKIEIETSGIITPKISWGGRVQFNVSPKLSNSRNFPVRLNSHAMELFSRMASKGKAIFKFVVMPEHPVSDFEEIQDVVNEYSIPRESVYIMPEGKSAERILEGMVVMADTCIRRGWNLSPRLHTLIWGNMRGK